MHALPLLTLSLTLLTAAGARAATDPAISRGEYLATAAGCSSCHTDSEHDGLPYAGGHRLETPYGNFVVPNITPDRQTGIGGWTDADFLAAVRDGVSPAGDHYYPAFPYASYAGMTERDVLDIKAYLDSLPAIERPNEAHELAWYLPGRWAMWIWQALFAPWEYPAPAGSDGDAEWQRGAYLVRHLGHCGECHTPRDWFGALR
ncbi:MAG: cytochrome c, partial [Gammaproteobacteria bacterium]|nr:cytochrome c [Gammaproteobacteria bacterium]